MPSAMEDLAASYRRHNEDTQTAAILRRLESLTANRVEVPDFPGASDWQPPSTSLGLQVAAVGRGQGWNLAAAALAGPSAGRDGLASLAAGARAAAAPRVMGASGAAAARLLRRTQAGQDSAACAVLRDAQAAAAAG